MNTKEPIDGHAAGFAIACIGMGLILGIVLLGELIGFLWSVLT